MKVIKPGIYGAKWATEAVCTGAGNGHKGCEAILLVDKKDLRYFKGVDSDSWGGSEPAVCFKCPICHAVTDLKKDKWPRDLPNLTVWTNSWYKNETERQSEK